MTNILKDDFLCRTFEFGSAFFTQNLKDFSRTSDVLLNRNPGQAIAAGCHMVSHLLTVSTLYTMAEPSRAVSSCNFDLQVKKAMILLLTG